MIELIDQAIDTNAVLAATGDPHCGAVVLFVGTTRQWTQKKDGSIETEYLHYEAYRQMALKQMQDLEAEARRRWPVRSVSMVHRLGRVDPSEPSVAVAVSTPHRSEAFEAAHWLIDQLKHRVPIWKQEHYVQSGPQWIHPDEGNCSCGKQETPAAEFADVGMSDREGVERIASQLGDDGDGETPVAAQPVDSAAWQRSQS